MAVLADVFVATKSEATGYAATPSGTTPYPRLQLTSITDLEFSTLWALLQEVEFDFDEHELESVDAGDGAMLTEFPAELVDELAGLSVPRRKVVAGMWAESEELQWPVPQAEEVLAELTRLATTARAESKGMYLLNCN